MPGAPQLAEVLDRFVERSGYSAGQLGRLSGIPKRTIANWLGGRVRRPRHTGDLLKLARALHLDEGETDELLQAANHPSVRELRASTEDEAIRHLLAQIAAQDRARSPFQAIPNLPYFVGRQEEAQALQEVLLARGQALICSLQGMGGVGKTALAAHLAYRLRPHFPDGVLWARVDRAEPMSVLSAFAGAYGRDVSFYTDVESRSQVVREILDDKQALIVLDNVRHSEEVKPLLPPSSGRCAVLITTRRQNLAVTSGTYRFTVGPFNKAGEEAAALFTQILGEKRVRREKGALATIADLLGHLPLAVAIAASRLAYEPGWSASKFLERLQQERKRLDLLNYDDQSVRLSARVSYDLLQAEEKALFVALGAFSPENVNVAAVAAVTGRQPQTVEETLRRLYALSLVQVGQGGHYRLHPLLHDFAQERLRDSQERTAVHGKLVDFYAGYVERQRHNNEALEQELDNIIAAVKIAHDEERHPGLIHIVTGLYDFLEMRGMYDLAADYLTRAREAAQSGEDRASLALVLLCRARLSRIQGQFTEAAAVAQEGLSLARQSEDMRLTSALLGELGGILASLGQRSEARTHYHEALDLARALNDPELASTHLLYLGIDSYRSNPEKTVAYYEEGLALARQIGDSRKTAKFLNNLGAVASDQGELAKAKVYFQESLVVAQALGYQELTGIALVNLGKIAREREEYEEARSHLAEARAAARRLSQKRLVRMVLEQLAELALAQKQYEAAESFYREALSTVREGEDKLAISQLLLKLGKVQRQREAVRGVAAADVEEWFRESLRLAREDRNFSVQASFLNEWGELLLQMGNRRSASTAFTEALALAKKGNFDHAVEEAKRGLSKTHKG